MLVYFWRLGGACRWRWALCQGRKATSSSQPTGCTMQFESGQFVSWSLQISDLASLRRRLRLACASPSVPPTHASWASQHLPQGLLSSRSPVPITARIILLSLSFFLCYSLLKWGNVFLLGALCCVCGLCAEDRAAAAHGILSRKGFQSTNTAGSSSSGWESGRQAEMCSCRASSELQ